MQQVHRALTEAPRRRSISDGPHPDLAERFEPQCQDPPLALAVEVGGILVNPAVMANLVAVVIDGPDHVRERADRVARNAERARDIVFPQKLKHTRRPHYRGLAARDHAGISRLVRSYPGRHAVDVECETYGQSCVSHRSNLLRQRSAASGARWHDPFILFEITSV